MIHIMIEYSIQPRKVGYVDFVTPLLKDNMLKFLSLFAQMNDDYY